MSLYNLGNYGYVDGVALNFTRRVRAKNIKSVYVDKQLNLSIIVGKDVASHACSVETCLSFIRKIKWEMLNVVNVTNFIEQLSSFNMPFPPHTEYYANIVYLRGISLFYNNYVWIDSTNSQQINYDYLYFDDLANFLTNKNMEYTQLSANFMNKFFEWANYEEPASNTIEMFVATFYTLIHSHILNSDEISTEWLKLMEHLLTELYGPYKLQFSTIQSYRCYIAFLCVGVSFPSICYPSYKDPFIKRLLRRNALTALPTGDILGSTSCDVSRRRLSCGNYDNHDSDEDSLDDGMGLCVDYVKKTANDDEYESDEIDSDRGSQKSPRRSCLKRRSSKEEANETITTTTTRKQKRIQFRSDDEEDGDLDPESVVLSDKL